MWDNVYTGEYEAERHIISSPPIPHTDCPTGMVTYAYTSKKIDMLLLA